MSETQIEDNKNSGIFGGPKTEEGKQVSRYNALKHGILRFALTEYENDIQTDILGQFMVEFGPVGPLETVLVERVTMYYIKLFRIARAENEHMRAILEPRVVKYSKPFIRFSVDGEETIIKEGYSAKLTKDNINELANIFQRYEVTVENRFYKTLHELERIQRIRKGEKLPPPVSVDITNSSSSFGENDK